jgi:hypothetical protein
MLCLQKKRKPACCRKKTNALFGNTTIKVTMEDRSFFCSFGSVSNRLIDCFQDERFVHVYVWWGNKNPLKSVGVPPTKYEATKGTENGPIYSAYNPSFSACFLTETVFFFHNKLANNIFQPAYQHSRTAPMWCEASTPCARTPLSSYPESCNNLSSPMLFG